jgi:hypothetical protein
MSVNDKNKPENWTLRSIEKKLQSFPKIEPPESLETKLMTSLQTYSPQIRNSSLALHIRFMRFAASTAAALLILAFMLIINYGLSTGPNTSFAQFDTSLTCPKFDSNCLLWDMKNNAAGMIPPLNTMWNIPALNDVNK